MKSLELQPTMENLIEAYKNDSIGRNEEVHKFIDLIQSIDENCSVALDGNWGSGKTFFVKQVEMIFNSFSSTCDDYNELSEIKNLYNQKTKKNEVRKIIPLYYDAWINDNQEDPLLSLIYELVVATNRVKIENKQEWENLFCKYLSVKTGLDVKKLFENNNSEEIFRNVNREKEISDIISEILEKAINDNEERLLIIIDELDRCKPSYAVKLLEKIKHYLNHEKITFVFAINGKELQHTIKQEYGDGFNAHGYLDRFFDLRVNLSNINIDNYFKLIGFYESFVSDTFMKRLIVNYHFEMREIEKFIRYSKMAFNEINMNSRIAGPFVDDRTTYFCIGFIVPLIIATKMYSIDLYYEFVLGRNSEPMTQNIVYQANDSFVSGLLLKSNELISDELFKTKVISLYNVVFGGGIKDEDNSVNVGNLKINRRVITMIHKTVSLVASFSNFSYRDEE